MIFPTKPTATARFKGRHSHGLGRALLQLAFATDAHGSGVAAAQKDGSTGGAGFI